jgi:hypothetical protein
MRVALATLWILAGSILTAGVYWTFLITPESTAWMLIASALLALAALALAGFTASGAIALLLHGRSAAGIRRALTAIAGAIPAAAIVLIVWWLTTRGEAWVGLRSGQINAYFIAQFGWDNMSWLFTTIHYIAAWCRWVLSGLLALSLIAGFVALGWSALGQAAWLRRALRPRALLVATLWFVVLIAVPWIYLVPWRPKALPASAVEGAFIAAKLSFSAVLFAIGAALIAREASAPLWHAPSGVPIADQRT